MPGAGGGGAAGSSGGTGAQKQQQQKQKQKYSSASQCGDRVAVGGVPAARLLPPARGYVYVLGIGLGQVARSGWVL